MKRILKKVIDAAININPMIKINQNDSKLIKHITINMMVAINIATDILRVILRYHRDANTTKIIDEVTAATGNVFQESGTEQK